MKTKRRKSRPIGYWQAHIRKWRQSGLKQAAYCRRHEFGQGQFGYWIRKLAKRSLVQPEQFVEVSERAPLPASVFAFEVEIPGGIRLRLDKADPETLKTVLQAVREAVC